MVHVGRVEGRSCVERALYSLAQQETSLSARALDLLLVRTPLPRGQVARWNLGICPRSSWPSSVSLPGPWWAPGSLPNWRAVACGDPLLWSVCRVQLHTAPGPPLFPQRLGRSPSWLIRLVCGPPTSLQAQASQVTITSVIKAAVPIVLKKRC